MKTHRMNLQSKYFDFIKDGTKRIELRLYDKKRQQIEIGDIIEFPKSETEKLNAKVTDPSELRRRDLNKCSFAYFQYIIAS